MTAAHLSILCVLLSAACARLGPAEPPPTGGDTGERIVAESRYIHRLLRPLESEIRSIRGRILELSRPLQSGSGTAFSTERFDYSSRAVQGLEHAVILRRARDGDRDEEIAADLNLLVPRGGEALSLRVSPDDRKIALSYRDHSGARYFVVYEIESRTARPLARGDIKAAEWSCGSSALLVTAGARGERVYEVNDSGGERKIFEEKDPAFFVGLSVSRSGEYVFVRSDGPLSSDTLLVGRCGKAAPMRFLPRRDRVRYSVDHLADRFYVVTNDGAANGRLLAGADPSTLSEILPERTDAILERVDLFDRFFAAGWRSGGARSVSFHDSLSGRASSPELPEDIRSLEPLPSPLRGPYRAIYSSYAREPAVLEASPPSFEISLGGVSDHSSELTWIHAESRDGTRIPVAVLSRRGAPPGGPLLLVGYGAYGDDPETAYSPGRRLLLERGFRIAFAYTRGGGFHGNRWHDEARGLRKHRAIEDFVASAEALLHGGLVSAGRLYSEGRSAGALLVASSAMERPELFGGIILDAPFLDVIGGLADSSGLLSARDTAEWGDPSNPEHRVYQATYSPMDRPLPESFPPAFVNASVDDEIVRFEEALEWVERIREVPDKGTVALMITSGTGHAGPRDVHSAADAEAVKIAFLLATDEAKPRD